jgi:hypothetical protein
MGTEDVIDFRSEGTVVDSAELVLSAAVRRAAEEVVAVLFGIQTVCFDFPAHKNSDPWLVLCT